MPRRKDSLVDLLVLLPWWVSVVLSGISYVALKFVIPTLHPQNFVFQLFAGAAPSAAPIVSIGLLGLAAISAVRSWGTRITLESQSGLDSLREIPWKQFEDLVAEAYRRKGFSVEENLGKGPDGGIDLVLFKDRRKTLVQCKRWKGKSVGAPVIRELYGLMNAEGANEGKLVTTSSFSNDAKSFAEGKSIELVDGKALLVMVGEVQRSGRITSTITANQAESSEHSCPACGRQMILRTARRGSNAGNQFWGCSGYPTCKETQSV